MIDTHAFILPKSKTIKFDKTWLAHDRFTELLKSWWDECSLTTYLGNSWKLKIQLLIRKFRGWSDNVRGPTRRNKSHLLSQIDMFEHKLANNIITEEELAQWKCCQAGLHSIYLEEEQHWQQRAKLKWFLEVYLNTRFFHIIATAR